MFDIPWQDLVFGAGNLIFLAALLPSLMSENKPAFTTSLLTGSVLALYSFTYVTLDLWISVAASSALSAGWLVLAWQKHRSDKASSQEIQSD